MGSPSLQAVLEVPAHAPVVCGHVGAEPGQEWIGSPSLQALLVVPVHTPEVYGHVGAEHPAATPSEGSLSLAGEMLESCWELKIGPVRQD